MRLKGLAVLACAGLAACVEQLPASLPPAQLGVTDSVPIRPASGVARSVHFFGWRRFGDDTTAAAIQLAKGTDHDLDLVNVLVDRRVHCFPACDAALITWAETAVTGTLVRYKGMPEWEKPKAPAAPRLDPGHAPPDDAVLERLMHLHSEDPKGAAEFYNSLDRAAQDRIVQLVLSKRGRTTAQGWVFRIPKDASAAEKRFLGWFVATYTTYQPLDD